MVVVVDVVVVVVVVVVEEVVVVVSSPEALPENDSVRKETVTSTTRRLRRRPINGKSTRMNSKRWVRFYGPRHVATQLALPAVVETAAYGLGNRRSIQLSYGS